MTFTMITPRHPNDVDHQTPYPDLDVNWRWRELWLQENPDPRSVDKGAPGFEEWYAELRKVDDRVWVAACFPQFRVWDWDEKSVALARELVSRHVCGVCGRKDDPGCWYNC